MSTSQAFYSKVALCLRFTAILFVVFDIIDIFPKNSYLCGAFSMQSSSTSSQSRVTPQSPSSPRRSKTSMSSSTSSTTESSSGLSFDGFLSVERTYNPVKDEEQGQKEQQQQNNDDNMTDGTDNDSIKKQEENIPPSNISLGSTATQITTSHEIRYHIHNRMNQSSRQAAPILVLHGGPGVPSDYLHPLHSVVPYRTIIFYDQLGCGRSMSGSPDVSDAYSIESSLDDLEALIRKTGLRRFHLYGQSFGGILAFELIKRIAEGRSSQKLNWDDEYKCLSVILSSTPSNVRQVEKVANDLISNLLAEDPDETTIMERFRVNHQCRTDEMPQPLKDAYDQAGVEGVWRGTKSIQEWEAVGPVLSPAVKKMPSCMIMRGEHDFVNEDCVAGWKDAFNHKFVRMKVLEGCSHHGLLEKGDTYGEMVDSYFAEHD